MNARRAANRRASMKRGDEGADYAQTGDVYGRAQAAPSGPLGRAVGFGTFGAGPVAGAGELPRRGPGRAAMRTNPDGRASENRPVPGNPGGISRYKSGNPPPRGYR